MYGMKSLRSEKGKKFASDFGDMVRASNWAQKNDGNPNRSYFVPEIEYTVR